MFDRFFFRAAEAQARPGEHHRVPAADAQPAERHQPRHAATADRGRPPRRLDDALSDLARLAIAAFGRGEGSGVLGVDVQRIRRALGLRTEPQPDLPTTTRATTAYHEISCENSSST